MKEFNIGDYKGEYAFQCILDLMISSDFEKKKKVEKMTLLRNFDRCVSYVSGMPYANIIEGYNYNDEEQNNIYIGNINDYFSGIELLFAYFVGKKQQYQKICVSTNDRGIYSNYELDLLKKCYTKSPLTGTRLYFPYGEEEYSYYLMNFNVSDAYVYAGEQTIEILSSFVDYKKLLDEASNLDERVFATEGLINQEIRIKDKMDRIKTLFQDETLFYKLNSKLEKLNNKIDEEWRFVSNLMATFEDSNNGYYDCVSCCFSNKIWSLLNDNGKLAAIEIVNEQLAKRFGIKCKEIDYSYYKTIDTNKDSVGLGNVSGDGINILKALLFSYAFSKVELIIDSGMIDSGDDSELTKYYLNEFKNCCSGGTLSLVRKNPVTKKIIDLVMNQYDCMLNHIGKFYNGDLNDVCISLKYFQKYLLKDFKKEHGVLNNLFIKKVK